MQIYVKIGHTITDITGKTQNKHRNVHNKLKALNPNSTVVKSFSQDGIGQDGQN